MNLFQQLLRRGLRPAAASQPRFTESRRDAGRRELLALAVRETLRHHGIPAGWIQAEANPVVTGASVRAIQLRLIARHWHPALASCVVALQRSVATRLEGLDPEASEWLAGISWKFEPQDESQCPALPSADYWQDQAVRPAPPRARPSPAAPATGHSLRRLLAEGDRAFAGRHVDAFSPTLPMLQP